MVGDLGACLQTYMLQVNCEQTDSKKKIQLFSSFTFREQLSTSDPLAEDTRPGPPNCYQTMKGVTIYLLVLESQSSEQSFKVGLLISVLYFPLKTKHKTPLSVNNLSSQVYLGKIKET